MPHICRAFPQFERYAVFAVVFIYTLVIQRPRSSCITQIFKAITRKRIKHHRKIKQARTLHTNWICDGRFRGCQSKIPKVQQEPIYFFWFKPSMLHGFT